MPTIVYRDGGLDPALLWSPFSMFAQLECATFGGSSWHDWPTFDVDDGEDATLLTADLPGMRDEDIDVSVAGSVLTVRGERKPTQRSPRRPYGPFERQFRLADGYDLDAISAHLADGVLTIHLPKTEKAKPRRIKLSAPQRMIDKVKGLLAGRSEGTAPGQ
jgi:HSP20 family protein